MTPPAVLQYAPLPPLALHAPQVRVILLDIRTQRDGYHAFNIAHRKFKFAAMIGAMLRWAGYDSVGVQRGRLRRLNLAYLVELGRTCCSHVGQAAARLSRVQRPRSLTTLTRSPIVGE